MPIPVTLDGEAFDEKTNTVDAFYERMREGAGATTSQPSPAAFLDAYELAAERGCRSVLSLHLDRRVSGVAASADAAADDASIAVTVVDLPTVSYGVALCVRAARNALVGGATAMQAAEQAKRVADTLENVFVARAAPRGRVPTSDEWAAVRFVDGTARSVSNHPTIGDATGAMVRCIVKTRGRGFIAVGHAGREVEAAADRLAHDLVRSRAGAVERYRVLPSVGAHTGPDSFGAFWRPAGRRLRS